jgi:protein TonB
MLQPEAKKAASTPLLVKSATANKQTQIDASPVQLPSPLAVASPSDSGLGALLSSASSSVSRPSLARIRISQGVSQGMVIKRVQPRYPANALSAHIQGAVLIEATVNKEGIVVNPKVLSGDTMLAAAALDAVRQWRYKPYYLDGEPVEIQTQITINFKVNQ